MSDENMLVDIKKPLEYRLKTPISELKFPQNHAKPANLEDVVE
jgi:hypothetical protein